MFNPKENLLEQQLAVSGLEMQWIGAVIGAATAVIGGISKSKQAAKNNKNAKNNEEQQRKFNKKIAKLTNEHNDKLDAADKANYHAMRDYSHETNMRNWERGKEIQDFEHASRLNQYYKSQAIGQEQLRLNDQAFAIGVDSEKAAIDEAFIQQQFQHQESMAALRQTYAEQAINRKEQNVELMGIKSQQNLASLGVQNTINQLATQNALQKETAMIENLVAQGAAQASMQAGKSKAKAQQANMASLHRSLMSLESELSGKYKQAAIQMAQINADASLAEMGVGLNLQRIENAISDAESSAQANIEVLNANMQSTIRESQRNIRQLGLERRTADVNTRAGMMIAPAKLPYAPVPTMPAERIFVERMEAIEGFVPKGTRQSTFAPIVEGIGSAAGTLASANFGGGDDGGGGGNTGDYGSGSEAPKSNIPRNIYGDD